MDPIELARDEKRERATASHSHTQPHEEDRRRQKQRASLGPKLTARALCSDNDGCALVRKELKRNEKVWQ